MNELITYFQQHHVEKYGLEQARRDAESLVSGWRDLQRVSASRSLAETLREIGEGCNGSRQNDAICIRGAAAIDALLDAIEAGGMVQPRPAPVMDLGPLRAIRDFNLNRAAVADGQNDIRAAAMYRDFARQLSIYFP